MKPIETSPAEPVKMPKQTLDEMQQLLNAAMESRAAERDLENVINLLKAQLEKTKCKSEHAESQVFDYINKLSWTPFRAMMTFHFMGSRSVSLLTAARTALAGNNLDKLSDHMTDKTGFVLSLAKGIKSLKAQI